MKDVQGLGLKIKKKRFFSLKEHEYIMPGAALTESLAELPDLNLGSEKAKSENIISPIVREIFRRNKTRMAFFSGYVFEVEPEKGLTGVCDFLFTQDPANAVPEAPVFFVVEAKNENLDLGTPQCIAEMYAARLLNERANLNEQRIFGAVTFGYFWRFLELDGDTVWQDTEVYTLANLPELLGALQKTIDLAVGTELM